jgi:hypothetical protein
MASRSSSHHHHTHVAQTTKTSEVTFMSSSVSCLAMSTLEASLRNRRAPGSPLECPDKKETGYGEQVQPSRVSLWDGAWRAGVA